MPQCLTFSDVSLPSLIALTTLFGVVLTAIVVLRGREFHGRGFFLIGAFATVGWLIMVLLELLAAEPDCKMTYAELSFFFIALLPTAWCYFLYDYANARDHGAGILRLASLTLAPLGVTAMAATNSIHQLFYLPETSVVITDGVVALNYAHGPLFYTAAAYLYTFMVGSVLIVISALFRSAETYRGYFLMLVMITLIPSVGNVAYVVFDQSFFGFDPTPFLFSVVMVILGLMIMTNRVFDIGSIAKNFVFLDADRPIAVIDHDGFFIVTNPSFDKLLSYAGFEGSVRIGDWPDLNALTFNKSLARQKLLEVGNRSYELRALQVDKPLKGSDEALGWALVLSDVTELRLGQLELSEALKRAESANRLKSQFIANMSHEIRTPLNGILGMAEVLSQEMISPRHAEMVRTIRQSGDVLLNTLNDILDLSKIEAGKMSLMPEAFQPTDILRQAEGLHRTNAASKGLELRVELKEDVRGLRRMGDSMRLMQILNNLLSNAVKFTETGHVSLEITNPETGPLKIVVTDTGIGMTDEEIARIFDDFEQGDGAITRKYGGTGLGMSIVRRLVEMMNGDIEIVSRKGAGTRVYIALPLPIAIEKTLKEPAPSVEKITLAKGLRVLAADDNSTNRLVLGSLLKRAGINATLVTNGREAVERYTDTDWDAVLLDIAMPEMDGLTALEAIDAIAAKSQCPRPPVIAISANVMPDQVAEYRAAGFDACLGKPFRSQDVLRTIKDQLAKNEVQPA